MNKKSLQRQQLNDKMLMLASINQVITPPIGWIKAIRTSLGMSMLQLGNKLSKSKQGIADIEKREKEGAITIKALREVGEALDMKLVYGFVPIDGSLDAFVEKKALKLATKIVMRTSNTMKLEDQENSNERIEKAIKERTNSLKQEMPKILWD
ncbi:mobile mystery protein A [Aquirufa nivalisilvae]|uniref:mobile mystery protein A n=1 Tax=Aquirufa nivalisilvae TaxID=2516557 RepID=UPI001032E36F|nr:mobile mystery protein A [Aquirufa nivalisilvae]TBH74793.1 mobile mystery protein A [Aquirufa nivalisilvae]